MRRRTIALLLAALLCLALGGCSAGTPSQTADGTAWDAGWTTFGGMLGVDAPAGMTLRENNDLMATNNICYAAWSLGQETSYTDASGEEQSLYDVQISMLLFEAMDAQEAEETIAGWRVLAGDRYLLEGDAADRQTGGQTYTVQAFTVQSAENPYTAGAAAFALRNNYAICFELSCRGDYTGQALSLLDDFLQGLHYAK